MEKLTAHFEFTKTNKEPHSKPGNAKYTADSDSSDEGIPIPEELSVS